jgi:hypothetical protein
VLYRALYHMVHTPGIEPGPAAWKAVVLPLHHVCCADSTQSQIVRADKNELCRTKLTIKFD